MTATPLLDEARRAAEVAKLDIGLRNLRERRLAARRLADRGLEARLSAELNEGLERRLGLTGGGSARPGGRREITE